MDNLLGAPPISYTCPTCFLKCKSGCGLTQHRLSAHRQFTPESDDDRRQTSTFQYHPHLNGIPCNLNANFLPPHTLPPPHVPAGGASLNPWHPFGSRTEFDFAHYHFVEVQSSEGNINKALNMWATTVMEFGHDAPWKNATQLYQTIDNIQHGDAPWKLYRVRYKGPLPAGTPPKWMTESYDLCMRDSRQVFHHQLATSDFADKIDITPYRQFDSEGSKRSWSNLMSVDWAWKQADIIAEDQATHGTMFVPIVAGSDKTTVSVATGHQQYHPVYMSPGNVTMCVATKKHRETAKFQTFCRQLYHASLAHVFEPLKPGMSIPEVVKCPDGHFHRAIYGLGPYIADYPEQVWLAAIVQGWCPKCDAPPNDLDREGARRRTQVKTDFLISAWDPGTLWTDFGVRADIVPFTQDFPRADIHELLSVDLLHQVIKGTFKDHLVMWVNEYLREVHGEARANEIIADIDHRQVIYVSILYGRDFQQWTGDDSKALMKVYLAAIAGHVPSEMVKCISAFLDFCYIARRNTITSHALDQLEDALARFHFHREAFVGTAGVNGDRILLPRQHSLKHYICSIRLFGSPNGLCSSITESKHIKAVKEPWRRSSRFKALVQMLRTIRRLDKLAAARRAHTELGMMHGTTTSYTAMILRGEQPQPRVPAAVDEDEDDDNGPVSGPKSLSSVELARTAERGYPRSLESLANHIDQPRFLEALRRFLYDQIHSDSNISSANVDIEQCPNFTGRIYVYHSAIARFFAPSDLCGTGGMYRECIRSNPNWCGENARHDTMFISTGSEMDAMQGMTIGLFPCALVHWLIPDNVPDDDTGMWVVQPEFAGNRRRTLSVIHLDGVARAAHLLPVYGSSFVPEDFDFSDSLDSFRAYFVNNCIDHHSHEFLS
ncbi:hypothetical protein BJV74DRAFT_877659 [Russula compacta]|nr:hypothetical protein BJV74DRAFT_877659 [Russula compacta]